MASVAEDELEYESDPEDTQISLTLRRREASDDEDEEDGIELPPRRVSDSESEGAAAEYDDDEGSVEFEEEEELEELEIQIGSDVKAVGVELDLDAVVTEFSGTKEVVQGEEQVNDDGLNDGGVYLQDGGENGSVVIGEKEKKENEPFAVPTAGAFYMHDDRFRDTAAGGRHRLNLGAYHARPSGQVPSLTGASSKETNMNNPANSLMPSQKQELANDEFGQRQSKARRYTEMKFDM